MIEKTETTQQKLLEIIDQLFVYNTNDANIKEAVINPTLTEESLQNLIEQTRVIIVGLYLTCEEDFVKGLNIFEAIIENQIKQTSVNQIVELEKALDKTLAENKTDIDAPVSQNIIINNGMKDEPEPMRRPMINPNPNPNPFQQPQTQQILDKRSQELQQRNYQRLQPM
jgi:hypothetical protein